jgi:hypothetical protein
METLRVDICYRPLRIAWAIGSDDRAAFRSAVRLSHTMRGGRFNPIVMVGRPDADDIVECFRADLVIPVGVSDAARAFADRYSHLAVPFFPDILFLRDPGRTTLAHVLDIHNGLVHWHDTPHWKALAEQGIRTFSWDVGDVLADVFLMQLGAYPSEDEIGIDYWKLLNDALRPHPAVDVRLDPAQPIAIETVQHPSVADLSRLGLERHYSIRPGWDHSGFFFGDAGDLDDLVCFWNLRAADIGLQFIDLAHLSRYVVVRPEYERHLAEAQANLEERRRGIAIWGRGERWKGGQALYPGGGNWVCRIGESPWSRSIKAPMMVLGEESSLGVMTNKGERPGVSFAMKDKPFNGDTWFHTQHLVASLSFLGVWQRDNQHSFRPPYIPELNEFFARAMGVHYSSFRTEPERIGLVIAAADHDAFVGALPVQELAERLFDLAGFTATLSNAGLIARQLIARLGGVDGARVFKIPGVRRLIKTHGPTASFTKRKALHLIGSKDPDNPKARFDDHEHLYIEPRPHGTKLTPDMTFAHLVAKGVFRIGADLLCPTCRLPSWIALDQLRQRMSCDLCGGEFDASRQLVAGEFSYRRSGVLGLERNAQGAVPVLLTLQQLAVNADMHHDAMFLPSLDLRAKPGANPPKCETDLFAILPHDDERKTQILIGECKDEGGAIDAKDVANMIAVADAFPRHRFEVFILFVKLAPFAPREIVLARAGNEPYRHRVILLTARELEPYHLYERTEKELGIKGHGGSLAEAARVTKEIYFDLLDTRMGLLRLLTNRGERTDPPK